VRLLFEVTIFTSFLMTKLNGIASQQ